MRTGTNTGATRGSTGELRRRVYRRRRLIAGSVLVLAVAAITVLAVVLTRPAENPPAPTVTLPAPAAVPWRDIGVSSEGRAVKVAVFGEGPQALLVIGGIHGDEYGGVVARAFAKALADDEFRVPSGWAVHVIGSLNPDGEHLGTRANARGVDVNRNLPTDNWSAVLDPEDRSAQEGLTPGSGPASEPEARALVDYLARGFDAVVALHSAGGIIDYDGDVSLETAQAMAELSGFPVEHLSYQGSITGSLGQYVSEKYGVPMITVELEGPELTSEIAAGLLAACR